MDGRRLTQGEDTCDGDTKEEEHEADEELTAFADGGEEWTASSSLPNLMQRRIHVLSRF